MIKYLKTMTPWERAKTLIGALIAAAFVYAMIFAGAALCVVAGHGPEVCGL